MGALVLSSFACGALFAKNVSGPALSSGVGATEFYTVTQFGTDVSACTAGKTWAQIAAVYNAVATNTGAAVPCVAAASTWFAAQPTATKASLLASLEVSATKGAGASLAMFAPLTAAYSAQLANSTNTTR